MTHEEILHLYFPYFTICNFARGNALSCLHETGNFATHPYRPSGPPFIMLKEVTLYTNEFLE
jgi:hypothetical protein